MTWSTASHKAFVTEVKKIGGIKAAVSQFGWNEEAVRDYIDKKRIPNHNTRLALAAQMGLPLNTFA